MKRYISIIITAMIFSAQLSFALNARAQELPKAPDTIEEAKAFSLRIITGLPNAMIQVWREQTMPIFQSMWQLAQKPLRSAWDMALRFLENELEKRKPDIKKEFQEEKEEMQSDLPKTINAGKSLWERLKELLE